MCAQAAAMYDRFFKRFEGNETKGLRYQFVLVTGQVFTGIPSVAKGDTADGSINVALDDGRSRTVQWKRLLNAAQLE